MPTAAKRVNYDAAHALAFYDIKNVKLFPVNSSTHAIVEYLRINKIIDDVLSNRLFGNRPSVKIEIDISDEWVKWLEENIALGCGDKQLLETLSQNFTQDTAEKALAALHAKQELEKITG